jgi:ammonium transporter Rh
MTKDSKESQDESRSHFRKFWTYYLFILMEMTMIILYSQFTEFGKLTNPKNFNDESTKAKDEIKKIYPFYQDVHVMIFIGFGFLMTFLKKYSWSAVAKNFLLAAWTVQFAILTIGFWKAVLTNGWHEKIDLDLHKLVDADFAAGSILIAFGAVLGKQRSLLRSIYIHKCMRSRNPPAPPPILRTDP